MMAENNDHYLWVEKYRPQVLSDCILPKALKTTFSEILEKGECQNLLLSGGAGCGKTTVAKVICNTIDADWMLINCSEDSGIDTLRMKIRSYATSISLTGRPKVIILDEFDYANPTSLQPALRSAMEEFSKNCRFIITCNFKNRVIEPIHSRCTCIDFNFNAKEKLEMCSGFFARVRDILDAEKVKYDEQALAKFICRYIPDFRRTLNELQRYSLSGEVDVGILSAVGDPRIKELMGYLRDKDFGAMRKWVAENSDNDQTLVFRKIYDALAEYLAPKSIPQAVLILGDYQYKAAFVADPEINMVAFMTELMMNCEFKS